MKAALLFLILVLPLSAGTGDGDYHRLVGNPAEDVSRILPLATTRPLKSFLGNPQAKIDRIRQILKEASRQILLQRGYLNDAISEVLRNENRITGGADRQEARRLVQANMDLFLQIEDIRLKIAGIQLRAQRQILTIETASFRSVRNSVSQQKQRIGNNPSAYWIWRRKQLLNETERGDALPEALVRKYYR